MKIGYNKTTVKKKDGVFKVGQSYSKEEFSNIRIDSDAFTDFKRRIFDCTKITYNEKSGRVNYMHFKERKMTDDAYNYGIK